MSLELCGGATPDGMAVGVRFSVHTSFTLQALGRLVLIVIDIAEVTGEGLRPNPSSVSKYSDCLLFNYRPQERKRLVKEAQREKRKNKTPKRVKKRKEKLAKMKKGR